MRGTRNGVRRFQPGDVEPVPGLFEIAAAPGSPARGGTLGDGAGVNPRNRLSPRVTVRLIRTLEADLAQHQHSLSDVLPVAGIDEGTLRRRLAGPDEAGRVVGKTGTYGDYGASALAGAFRSPQHGTVYFAVLNRGIPVVPARRRQDAFLRGLLQAIGSEPWPYRRDDAPAFTRAVVE